MDRYIYYFDNVIYNIKSKYEYDEKCPEPILILNDDANFPGINLIPCCNGTKFKPIFVSLSNYIEDGDVIEYSGNKYIFKKNAGENGLKTYYEYIHNKECEKIISTIINEVISANIILDENKYKELLQKQINFYEKPFLIQKAYDTYSTRIKEDYCYNNSCSSPNGWHIIVEPTETEAKDISELDYENDIKNKIRSYALSLSNPILLTIGEKTIGFKY